MQNTIIYLLGFSGTGKYTIAREIVSRTGARLVDNHYLNNPVFSLIPQDGTSNVPEAIWDRVAQVRAAVLETIATLSPPDWSFIFTNEATGKPDEVATFHQIAETAARRDAVYVPVRLLCDIDELCRRVATPARRELLKSIDPQEVRDLALRFSVYDPGHPATLTLDVTALSADEAAQRIIDHAATLGLR